MIGWLSFCCTLAFKLLHIFFSMTSSPHVVSKNMQTYNPSLWIRGKNKQSVPNNKTTGHQSVSLVFACFFFWFEKAPPNTSLQKLMSAQMGRDSSHCRTLWSAKMTHVCPSLWIGIHAETTHFSKCWMLHYRHLSVRKKCEKEANVFILCFSTLLLLSDTIGDSKYTIFFFPPVIHSGFSL